MTPPPDRKRRHGALPHRPGIVAIIVGTYFTCTACGLWDQPAKQPPPPPPAPVHVQQIEVDHVAVCADPRNHQRVDDDQCRHAPLEYLGTDEQAHQYRYTVGDQTYFTTWYYIPVNQGGQDDDRSIVAVSGQVSGGTYRTPTASKAAAGGTGPPPPVIVRQGSVPPTGATVAQVKTHVQRGGFGVSSGTSHGTSSAS